MLALLYGNHANFYLHDYENLAEVVPISGASGGRVELPCDVTAALPADSLALVIWYKQGHAAPVYTYDTREETAHWSDPATFGSRATFTTESTPAVLILEKLRPEDSGVYRCRVDYSRSPTKNSRLNLTVLIPPERLSIFDNDNREVVGGVLGPYDEGARVNVTCVAVGGRPIPKVSWWKSHALLGTSEGSSTVTLQLRRQDLDSEVTCQALTDPTMAPVSKIVTIDMNLPPVWVKLQGANRPFTAGQKTELVCQVAGARPKPSISWWKSGVRLTSVKESKDGNITTSVVTFVPSVEDAGRTISCRTVQPTIPMSTREDGKNMTILYAPVVTLNLGSNLDKYRIVEGSDVYLDCRIHANPWHTSVHFTHNGSPVRPGPGILVANQSLVLQKISRNMKGPYVCVARNSKGEGRSLSLHLDVKFPPSCKNDQNSIYRASKGDTVEIQCEMQANPSSNLTYHWWFNASSHTRKDLSNEKSNLGVFPYKVLSAADYGWVMCTADNDVGQISRSNVGENSSGSRPCVFHILPAEKPSPVQECLVENVTHDSLFVNCTPGHDGGSKQHFLLEVFDSATNQRLQNSSSTQPYFNINMLPASSNIAIRVKAANIRGVSRALTIPALTLAPPQSYSRDALPITVELTPLLVVAGAITLGLIITSIAIVLAVRCRSRRRRRDHKKDEESKNKMSEEETSNVPLTQTKVTDSIDSIDKNPDIIPMDSLPRDSSSNASTDYSTMKPLLSRSYTHQNSCWSRDISPQYMCTPLELRRGDIYSQVQQDDRTLNRNTIRAQDWSNCESLVALNPGGLLTTDPLHHPTEYISTPPPPAMYGAPLHPSNYSAWSCSGNGPFAGNPYVTTTAKGFAGACRSSGGLPVAGCFVRPAMREARNMPGHRLLVTPPILTPSLNLPNMYELSESKQTNTPSNTHEISMTDKQTNVSL